MANVGPMELLVVLIIALLVFGPKRLPEMGSSLGKAMRDFRSALAGEHDAEAKQAPEAKPKLPVADERASEIADPGTGATSTQSRDQVS
ncbi:MAG: twin-arginine translocase TatA/TatE family subunit [Solirubrobacterales bacterium]